MSSKLDEMRARLQAHLQEFVDEIGPRVCPHGDYAACEECEWDDTSPMPGSSMLSEFVLVMNWTSMESGEVYLGMQKAPNQLMTHTNGLLHTALYEF